MTDTGLRVDPAEFEQRKRKFEEVWDSPKGILGFFQIIDNVPIAVRYMATSFAFFIVGGILALIMRLQLSKPDNNLVSAETYNQLFTMHGTTMMFLFVIPFLEAFANYLIPLLNGTRDLPFPRLTALSYWTYLFGGIFIYSSFFFGLAPDGGWFAYMPLNLKQYSPGLNMDFWDIGLSVAEVAAIGAAAEMIVGILRMRAPGMSLNRMPLFCWAMLVTSIMIVFAFTPLIVGTAMLELDRKEITRFFDANYGGDPLLWQHIFWVFGHPEVYIMFLPAVGVMSHVVQTFSRRPVMSYTMMVLALIGTAFLAFGLWVHHMYTTGISPLGMGFFAAASMAVSIPSAIQVYGWILTLWAGKPVWRTPLLFAMGGLVIFIIGGVTGVMVAAVPFDLQAHDTYFIVAHLHYVLIGGVLFPIFAGLYYWIPKFSGRMMHEGLGRWNALLMFVGFNLAFLPMHWAGLHGMPRRVYTFAPGVGLEWYNLLSTIGAFIIAFSVLLFLINLAVSLRSGKAAGNNPWGGDSLEWSQSSPPENAQFACLPVVRSRHPMWDQTTLRPLADDDAAVARAVHLTEYAPTTFRGSLVVDILDGHPIGIAHLPRRSIWPFVMAVGLTVLFVAALVDSAWTAVTGAAIIVTALVGWFWPLDTEAAAIAGPHGRDHVLPLAVGDRSSNGYWGTCVLVVILFVSLATLVTSHFYLADSPSALPDGRVPPPTTLAFIASGLAAAAAIMTRILTISCDRDNRRLRIIAIIALLVLWNAFIWTAFSSYRTGGFLPAAGAYDSSVLTLFGYSIVVAIGAGGMCAAALLWRLLAPADPRGRGVALNASLISYSSTLIWFVATTVVHVWPRFGW
ncbi:MAG: cytochrome c oxidase subunit I [Phycisphaerae bacterium]|nr:cytochrome c oxidase subunit I [Gemmatimonadaceae bacterium]